jgi:hypothetical protein
MTAPLILGTNSIKDTGYDVANSARFNDGNSAFMTKASTTVTNDKKFTVSAWCKRSSFGGGGGDEFGIFKTISDSNNQNKNIQFGFYQDHIYFAFVDGGAVTVNKVSNAHYRDPSAWYHVMLAVDSTQGTAANRNRIYVNGTEVTSFGTDTNAGADETFLSTSCNIDVGRYTGTSGTHRYFDGYLAEVVFIDGLQLTPSSFGEFDSDSPSIWRPVDVSGLTFGNNGFYLDFEDSSNLGNDANGGTDLTESGLTASDQTTDTCTNNFCTLNPLINSGGVYSEGNCKLDSGDDNKFVWGTMATSMNNSSAGWYYEVKIEHTPDTTNGYGIRCGCGSIDFANTQSGGMGTDGGFGLSNDTSKLLQNNAAKVSLAQNGGNNAIASGIDGANGQIFNIAWKNGKTFFGVNGVYIANDGGSDGNPSSGTNQSYDIDSSVQGDFWVPIFASSGSTGTFSATIGVNFGNPTFSISSGNADANGFGNFEYEPPTGFYSICSKNLAEFG